MAPHSQSTVSKEQETNSKEQENEGLTAYIRRRWGNLSIAPKAWCVLATVIILIAVHKCDPELAKFITYLVGGILIILQISNSNRRATASEETAKAMQKTVELTEKGNIAERFKNAIEHMGNDSASIRLGGIYALHHIAQETEEYRERVFEILCAHIRETTTQEGYKGWETVIRVEEKITGTIQRSSIEIQSILNLLFIKKPDRKIYEGIRANLSGANLSGAILSNANLESVDLSKATLEFTSFRSSNLKYAFLYDADLGYTIFSDANLQGAWLNSARNLKIEQLLQAKTLYQAKLPDEIKEEITKQKPELFEDPADK